jgi:hypothetical protein
MNHQFPNRDDIDTVHVVDERAGSAPLRILLFFYGYENSGRRLVVTDEK